MGQLQKKKQLWQYLEMDQSGLLHLQISKKLYGAKTIVVGKNAHRIERAKLLGADAVTSLSADKCDRTDNKALRDALDFTEGIGANVIVIATSDPAHLGLHKRLQVRIQELIYLLGRVQEISFQWILIGCITIK